MESFNSQMKAYITENLVNGCSGRLILFHIDIIVGIFSTQGSDLKYARAAQADCSFTSR